MPDRTPGVEVVGGHLCLRLASLCEADNHNRLWVRAEAEEHLSLLMRAIGQPERALSHQVDRALAAANLADLETIHRGASHTREWRAPGEDDDCDEIHDPDRRATLSAQSSTIADVPRRATLSVV